MGTPRLSDVFRDLFSAEYAHWQAPVPAILRTGDPESVHAMRVAGRKLRASLRLFEDYLEPGAQRIDRRLKEIGADLGNVRDLQVHLNDLTRTLRRWTPSARSALSRYRRFLHQRLQAARRILAKRLRGSAWEHLKTDLAALAEEGFHEDAPSAATITRKLLKSRFKKLSRASKAFKTEPSDAAWHRFRRACRRLRYAAQFFEPIGGHRLKKVIKRLGRWQDLLGLRQDRQTGIRLLSQYLQDQPGVVTPAEQQALLKLAECLEEQKALLQEEVLLGWNTGESRRIKRNLKRAI